MKRIHDDESFTDPWIDSLEFDSASAYFIYIYIL